jgi:hypothetical protein
MMDFSQLPGKIIADRNSKKLGFVVDIRNSVSFGKEKQKPKVTMLVKIERAFKDAITAEVEAKEIIKIEGYYAWLDTTKKEFLEAVKKARSTPQVKKEIKKVDLSFPKSKPAKVITEKKKPKEPIITGELSENAAFKEYSTGRGKGIKTPWATIVILGIATAALSFILYIYGIVVLGNPFAMNMIIGLLGLPAGFIIAFKNKTLDIMISWRYSSFTGIIYTISYFIIGVIALNLGSSGISSRIGTMISLVLSCLVIGVYSILVTFGIGALLGTMVHGYLDDKK